MTGFRTIEGAFYDQYKARLDVMEALDEAQQLDLSDVVIMGTLPDGSLYVKTVRQPDTPQ